MVLFTLYMHATYPTTPTRIHPAFTRQTHTVVKAALSVASAKVGITPSDAGEDGAAL